MLRGFNSWKYCAFRQGSDDLQYLTFNANATPQYSFGSGFWNPDQPIFTGPAWTTGTRTGLIDVGPFLGTASLHLKQASPIWAGSFYGGPARTSSWIIGLWVYPINFSGQHTLLVWQNSDDSPNYGTSFSLGITADGHVQLMSSGNPNINVAPGFFDPANGGGVTVLTSSRICAVNSTAPTPGSLTGWTHISLVLNLGGLSGGSARLYVNGCADATVGGLTLTAANLLTLMWLNPSGPDEICLSQFMICDSTGPFNNSNVSQSAQALTLFPSSDVATGWSGGYALVNCNPGPCGTSITLSSLSSPDELFGFPAASVAPRNLGVALTMCVNAPAQTFAGLVKKSGESAVQVSPSLGPLASSSGFWTRQAFSEFDPDSSAPWLTPDISAAAWGMRGLLGTGQQVSQFFLEQIWQPGPARCGVASYSY